MTMDARGGCCIARYATGAYDMSKVDRIMLRFRPIAPKPVAASTNSGGSSSESSTRPKRKYVRDNSSNKNKRCNNKRRKSPPATAEDEPVVALPPPVTTLPLLPETPDRKDPPPSVRNNVPMWLSFENSAAGKADLTTPFWDADRTAGSCVTVERVTGTWAEGDGLGSTDEERRVKLSKDTCPGFISDGYGRVTWTNGAYGKMVGQGQERVWLMMREKVGMMVAYTTSFTCRVRLEYNNTCGNNKKRSSLTVPCDVWRMDSGGFAWRLDVNAALSLSLPP